MTDRMVSRGLAIALGIAASFSLAGVSFAQQANIETPFNGASHSYHERIGVRWGLRGNGWFFNFGGPAPTPAFGGFDPNSGANFGFGGPNGFFSLSASQGSDRSLVSSSPSVTVMNGGMGFFSDTQQRPFVTGLVPVVGSPIHVPSLVPDFGAPQSVLQERLHRLRTESSPPATDSTPAPAASSVPAAESSAARGDLSVAEIKAGKAADKSSRETALAEEIAALLERAQGKLEAGQANLAKIYLQMAARKATGEQRAEILKRMEGLEAGR